MIVRTLPDGTALVITQEAHADLAAQLAAHWGNDRFAKLVPYEPTVFGTIYHDSSHREMEADLPIDVERGLPYQFRGAPPANRRRESDVANVQWIEGRSPYASLLVQMHHNGLRKGRYGTVRARYADKAPAEDLPDKGFAQAVADLSDEQRALGERLGLIDEGLWHNYQALQVFDLLSLHFCCDGFVGDQMKDLTLERAPIAPSSGDLTGLTLHAEDGNRVFIDPYPFDAPGIEVGVAARRMTPAFDEPGAREAYHKAPRVLASWVLQPR